MGINDREYMRPGYRPEPRSSLFKFYLNNVAFFFWRLFRGRLSRKNKEGGSQAQDKGHSPNNKSE